MYHPEIGCLGVGGRALPELANTACRLDIYILAVMLCSTVLYTVDEVAKTPCNQ